jgi:hypothetical protein
MQISTQEDSNKIYFVFLWHLYNFLCILEVNTIFWKYLKKPKFEKDYPGHRADFGPRPLPLRTGGPWCTAGHKAMVGRTG